MKTKPQLEAAKAKLEARREELFKLKEPIDTELQTSGRKIEGIIEELGKLSVSEQKDQVNWQLFATGKQQGMELHRFYESKLLEYHASSWGAWNDTGERNVQFMFFKKEEPTKQLELIRLLTPLFTPSTEGDSKGYVRYSISTKDLSESGCVELWVTPDGSQALVNKRSWGSDNTIFSQNTLEEAVKWLTQYQYYRKHYEK